MRKASVAQQSRHNTLSPHGGAPSEERSGGRRKSLFPVVGGRRASLHPLDANKLKKLQGGKGPSLDGREASAIQMAPNLEPTYRMEPDKRFFAPDVHQIIKETLENHLDGFQFNPKFTTTMTKVLSDELKDRVKQLGFPRYKLVTSVVMGERREQGIMITSRCAWDVKLDSYATYTYQNKSLFCTASVYGIYRE
ncbi:dynein light chain Tctex-type protein 2B-like [Babylonia areolata]|uniref:dynein light chain Tctex-type protein 2B-like n=1 Tax=Babylonia areolata TaxID=304850 RepID=UPI003FD181C0